jgi:hypothetical protein
MIQELTRIAFSEDTEEAPEILVTDFTRLPEIDQAENPDSDDPEAEV